MGIDPGATMWRGTNDQADDPDDFDRRHTPQPGEILAAAKAGLAAERLGSETACIKSGSRCPRRIGHPDACDRRTGGWTVPADWTLADQYRLSTAIQHGAFVAYDMRTNPYLGEQMSRMVSGYDTRYDLAPGQTVQALALHADWVAAIAAVAAGHDKITRIAERAKASAEAAAAGGCVETDYDHKGDCDGVTITVQLLTNHTAAQAGAIVAMCTSHAEQNKVITVGTYEAPAAPAVPECAEPDHDHRGDCDGDLVLVEFLTNLGLVETRQGEHGHMCGSHSRQAAARNQVRIIQVLTAL